MKCFVFVVCGSKEHVSTLNFSLKFLRKHSASPILVVTDNSRNEIPIEHDNIINVSTPRNYNHHEASIYLKTGLHKFVPDLDNTKYCYLDSDIVAISTDCNKIFDFNPEPILFVKDHCEFSNFSPDAMNCDCKEEQLLKNANFYEKINSVFPNPINFDNQKKIEEKEKLDKHFKSLKRIKIKNVLPSLKYFTSRYILSTNTIKLGKFTFVKSEKCWYNDIGQMIDFDFPFYEKKIKKAFGFRFSSNKWFDKDGNDITPKMPACFHLSDHFKRKYGIEIHQNWHHWNGGVFLFNKQSVDFLNYWHKITLDEFNDCSTKTRDQGTLAVSTWKFKLQDMKTLPVRFNFITEYANPNIKWDSTKGYTYDNFKTEFKPAFLHIYHHWGDKKWSIWQSVLELGKNKEIL